MNMNMPFAVVKSRTWSTGYGVQYGTGPTIGKWFASQVAASAEADRLNKLFASASEASLAVVHQLESAVWPREMGPRPQ